MTSAAKSPRNVHLAASAAVAASVHVPDVAPPWCASQWELAGHPHTLRTASSRRVRRCPRRSGAPPGSCTLALGHQQGAVACTRLRSRLGFARCGLGQLPEPHIGGPGPKNRESRACPERARCQTAPALGAVPVSLTSRGPTAEFGARWRRIRRVSARATRRYAQRGLAPPGSAFPAALRPPRGQHSTGAPRPKLGLLTSDDNSTPPLTLGQSGARA